MAPQYQPYPSATPAQQGYGQPQQPQYGQVPTGQAPQNQQPYDQGGQPGQTGPVGY